MSEKARINGIRVIPTEEEEQTVVFSWAAIQESRWPELRLMHHIPNGGKRSKSEAARFRAAGVKAGVSDIFLPCARCGYHGLYIEMKARDGRVSHDQAEFLSGVTEQGYLGVVCYGADQAIKVISGYMEGKIAPSPGISGNNAEKGKSG